jgi:hypothetical protein
MPTLIVKALPVVGLVNLNTLVLSHNKLDSIDVRRLLNLRKLTLSHNNLRKFPEVGTCHNLKELRLNGNRIVTVVRDNILLFYFILFIQFYFVILFYFLVASASAGVRCRAITQHHFDQNNESSL